MSVKQARARARRSVPNVDPVDSPEIARRCGVQLDTVRKWRKRHDDFPEPTWQLYAPLWEWTEVAVWLDEHDGEG